MTGMDDLNDRMTTSNGLQIMNLGVALAQSSQLNDITRLQNEANRISQETNQHLRNIHSDLTVSNEWLEQVSHHTAENTQQLKQLNEQVDTTNQLLREQLQGIQSVKSSIDRLRFETAWQNFSNWIQTPNGKTYQKWTKQATRMIDTMGEYTRRMNKAREQDLKTLTSQMIVNQPPVTLEDYKPTPKPTEPAIATPVNPGPEPKTRRLLYSKLGMNLTPILGILLGAAYGYMIPTEMGRRFHEDFHNLTPLAWNMIVTSMFGLVIGLFLAVIISGSFDHGILGKHTHDPNYRQWKQATIDYQQAMNRNNTMRRQYRQELTRWETDRHNTDISNQRKTDAYTNTIQQLPDRASSLLPDPTCWTIKNPNEIAKQVNDLMTHSFTFPPADMSILPATTLPVFAMPDSLPHEARHMKAELARILEENRRNPDAKVAFGKPLSEMSAADRLRKFSRE